METESNNEQERMDEAIHMLANLSSTISSDISETISNVTNNDAYVNLIKANLEKECSLRKHCETVIEDLQKKSLKDEQELFLLRNQIQTEKSNIKVLEKKLNDALGAREMLEKASNENEEVTKTYKKTLLEQMEGLKKENKLSNDNLETCKLDLSKCKSQLYLETKKYEHEFSKGEAERIQLTKLLEEERESLKKQIKNADKMRVKTNAFQEEIQNIKSEMMEKDLALSQAHIKISKQCATENQLKQKFAHLEGKITDMESDYDSIKVTLEIIQKEKDTLFNKYQTIDSERLTLKLQCQELLNSKFKEWEKRKEEIIRDIYIQHDSEMEELEKKLTKENSNNEKLFSEYCAEKKLAAEDVFNRLKLKSLECKKLEQKLQNFEGGRAEVLNSLHDTLQLTWQKAFRIFYNLPTEETENTEYPNLFGNNASLNDISNLSTDTISTIDLNSTLDLRISPPCLNQPLYSYDSTKKTKSDTKPQTSPPIIAETRQFLDKLSSRQKKSKKQKQTTENKSQSTVSPPFHIDNPSKEQTEEAIKKSFNLPKNFARRTRPDGTSSCSLSQKVEPNKRSSKEEAEKTRSTNLSLIMKALADKNKI